MRLVPWFSALAVLLATVPVGDGGLAEAVADHDRHPGLGHPPEGDRDHQHGDPDDHHETPDSPCHHHDEHTCCNAGPTLALAGMTLGFEAPSGAYPPVISFKTRLLPSVRDLFHVPLG